jgi:hypothetical protein
MRSHSIKRHTQQGGALIILVLVLVIAGTTAMLSLLDGNSVKLERNKKTYAALAEAKAALIGYALQHASKPGTLPCTDSDNNGMDNPNGSACATYIGRFPWKELDVPMLRDGHAECLWYALSPIFRQSMTVGMRSANPLNSTTNGTISLVDDAENSIVAVNPVIAVIMAPQNPVSGQSRSGAATTYCPGDSLAANYLDLKGAVNNATGNVIGNNYTFKLGSIDNSFNDQIVYVTANELYPLLRKRITKEILGDVDVPSGLIDYYQTFNAYPCPAKSVAGDADCSPPLGNNVPYNDEDEPLQYSALGNWLENNGWFTMASYQYISPTSIKVTVADPLGSYTCDADMNIVSCSSP